MSCGNMTENNISEIFSKFQDHLEADQNLREVIFFAALISLSIISLEIFHNNLQLSISNAKIKVLKVLTD